MLRRCRCFSTGTYCPGMPVCDNCRRLSFELGRKIVAKHQPSSVCFIGYAWRGTGWLAYLRRDALALHGVKCADRKMPVLAPFLDGTGTAFGFGGSLAEGGGGLLESRRVGLHH